MRIGECTRRLCKDVYYTQTQPRIKVYELRVLDFFVKTCFQQQLCMGRRLSKIFFSFYKDKFCNDLTYLLQYDIL